MPAKPLLTWLDRQPADSIWLTSVTVFEARFGIESLPRGRRLATRNVRYLGDLSVEVVDPWDGA